MDDSAQLADKGTAGRDLRSRLALERVQTASDQIAHQLRELILSGALPSGARLPTEAEMARRSGVSRGTIREALQVLAAEGLTQARKGGVSSGTFVTVPSRDRVVDTLRLCVTMWSNNDGLTLENLLEMREVVEVPAAGFAAERATATDIDGLSEAIEREAAVGVPGDSGERAGDTFHELVISAAYNPLLSVAALPIQGVLLADGVTVDAFSGKARAEIHAQHRDIAAAIAAKDPEAARRLMREHLRWVGPRHARLVRARLS